MQVRKISEKEFEKLSAPILFENKLTNRVFGQISIEGHTYKFSWQSDEVNPVILSIRHGIVLIGIDVSLVIFNYNTGKVLLELSLDYFFFDAKIYDDFIFVISELEIIKIYSSTFEVARKYGLPDFIEEIEFKHGRIEVKCAGQDPIILDE